MIKSMTGYGRCENESEGRKFSVEIKAVNKSDRSHVVL